jgi:cell division protein FtsI (penicillin-binding protein 3)
LFRKDYLRELADSQHLTIIPLEGERGKIYDREGRVLATNLTTYSLYANPYLIQDRENVISSLVRTLDIPEDILREKIESPHKFVWIKRKISWDQKHKIEGLNLKGLGFIPEIKRFYPQGQLASHIIGGVDIDNRGIEGIELFYEQYLGGKEGYISITRDAASRNLFLSPSILHPQKGLDLTLTLDTQIQYWAETFLKQTIEEFGACAGSVIVMDPFTGAILSLANWPKFDPNSLGQFPPEHLRNRAITDIFEPGSAFKIVTLVAAVAQNEFSDKDVIFCEQGRYKIPGSILHDWKPYGQLSFREVFKKSSNIGVAKIADRLGKDTLYKYIKKLCFGEKTQIDLPGEVAGLVKSPSVWSNTSRFIIPIGQEVGTTLLQLAEAMSIIANGGYWVRPHLVKKISGEHFYLETPIKRKRVLPEWVSKKAKEILVEVVEEGTGKRAKIEGVEVGGKTGTAQKFDPSLGRYSYQKYRASFVGFLNKDSVSLVIAVSIDEPRSSHFGGVVAAPLFKRIGKLALQYIEYKHKLAKLE